MHSVPEGLPAAEVIARLDALRTDDVRWREGRAFSLAYSAGPEVERVAAEAHRRFATENALNTDAFPSLRTIQSEVVAIVAGWLAAGPDGAGFMTSGGTESLLLAVKGSRERGRRERGITHPNIVLPTSAHAAFEKGCHYFGLESRRVEVGPDWRADVDAMADAIDENTVLVVGSAPQYPQGVIDPIPAIAALAAGRDINCHVDACMGGITLTFLRRLGHEIPPWNFEVPGVTSISVDLHKYGYSTKGASVLMHRTKTLRSYQTYVTDNWLGGLYGSSGILGTKGGGPMAAAWAVMHLLGDEGYLELTARARGACDRLAALLEDIDDLELRARPEVTLIAFGAADPDRFDVYALADALWRRGWYLDRQGPPASLHCTVNAVHADHLDEFEVDLRAAVAEVRGSGSTGSTGAYGSID